MGNALTRVRLLRSAAAVALFANQRVLASSTAFIEHSAEGVLIGSLSLTPAIVGEAITWTLLDDQGGRVKVVADTLQVGATETELDDHPTLSPVVQAVSTSRTVVTTLNIGVIQSPLSPPASVLVSNDAELTSALDTYKVAGNVTITLATAGTFAAGRSFAGITPASPIVIKGQSALTWSKLPSIVLGPTARVQFQYIDHGDSTTSGGNCIFVNGATTALDCFWSFCDLYGAPLDPHHTYTSAEVSAITRNGVAAGASGVFENLHFTDCDFHDLRFGIRSQTFATKGPEIEGCTFDRIMEDDLQLGFGGSTPPKRFKINWNIFGRTIGQGASLHSDTIQIFTNQSPAVLPEWECIGNRFITGSSNGEPQGPLWGSNTPMIFGKFAHNIMVCYSGNDSVFQIDSAGGSYFFNNRGARYVPESGSETTKMTVGLAYAGRVPSNTKTYQNFIGYNVARNFDIGGQPTSPGNYKIFADTTAAYNGAYVGPYSAATDTDDLADVEARYHRKSGHVQEFLNDAVDYAARTIDYSKEPGWCALSHFYDQTTSTVIMSDWVRIIGGGPGMPISITNGEYQIADDAAGTNAGSWSSTTATVDEYKYIRVRQTSPSTASTTKETVLTLNGYANRMRVTTSAVTPYVAPDNGGAAYSLLSAIPTGSGVKKIIFAVRFDPTTLDSAQYGANIAGGAGGSGAMRLYWANPRRWSFALYNTNTGLHTPTYEPEYSDQTHIIHIDCSQSSGAAGFRWFINGRELDWWETANWNATNLNPGLSIANMLAGFGVFALAGGNIFNGKIAMVYMDWGDANYVLPDITDPAYRDKFLPDNIGADGSGPTGAQPKLCFYGPVGNADGSTTNSWNATGGLVNRGAFSSALVKQAGTYA